MTDLQKEGAFVVCGSSRDMSRKMRESLKHEEDEFFMVKKISTPFFKLL